MRVHVNQIGIRIMGTLTGIGFLAIGLYSLFAGGPGLSDIQADRAWGFGLVACIGGVWATTVSWLASDLSGIWCRPPRKGFKAQ